MKKVRTFLNKYFLTLICIAAAAQSPVSYSQTEPAFSWVKNIGGLGYDRIADVASDNNGNIIIIGSFESTLAIGSTNLVSTGGADIFLAKFDTGGNPLWAVQAGGAEYDEGLSLDIDGNGDIVVAGLFSGSASFGSNILTSRGGYDIFICKYSESGTVQWVDRAGGAGYEYVGQLTTDNLNNILFTGEYEQSAFFDTISVPGGQVASIFLAKYNSTGDAQWVRTGISNLYYPYSYGIATSSTNDVYITGSFQLSINFSGTILTGQDGADIFINKYSTNGDLLWAIPATGLSFNDQGRDILVDKNDDVYVTGSFGQTVNFGTFSLTSSGQTDAFIVKLRSDGDPVWAIRDGQGLLDNVGESIVLDNAGNITVASSISQVLLEGEVDDIYLTRYDKNGAKLWGFVCGGPNSDSPEKLAVDNNGDIVFTGYFYDNATFSGTPLLSNGQYDGVLGKLPSPELVIENTTVDFDTVAVGSSNNLNVPLMNQTNATLHVFSGILRGTDSLSFSFGQIPGTIGPLQTYQLSVNFSPLSTGTKSAYIIFESDSPGSPDTLFLTGTAGSTSLMISTSLLDFGTVDTDNFTDRQLTITNTGTEPVAVLLPLIIGLNQSEFSILNVSEFPDTLVQSEVKNVQLRFSPTSSGTKSAQMQILSNAPSSPDVVDLQGIAVTGITVEVPAAPMLGQNVLMNVVPPAGFQPTSGEIFYRVAGELAYNNSPLTLQGTNYLADIPPQFVTIKGLQFYIIFTDGSTTVTYPTTNPQVQPAVLEVSVPLFPFALTIPNSVYRMVSVPLQVADPGILSVFSDDFGQYDSTVWRIFRWQSLLNEYAEFPDMPDQITPGKAFWLIHSEGRTFDVDNAVSMESLNDFMITLAPNSWTQIGNPFAFIIDWASLLDTLSLPLYSWNPDSLDYEMNLNYLDPWEGYFVRNNYSQSVTIAIPPIRAIIDKKNPGNTTFANGEFLIKINSGIDGIKYKDNQNYVGMINDQNNPHSQKLLEPPPITNDIRLSIIENNKRYAQNTVGVNPDGAVWMLTLNTSHLNKDVVLNFEELSSLPDGFEIYLFDMDREISIPTYNNTATLKLTKANAKNLKLIIGTAEFAKENSGNIPLTPVDFILNQNYPNPFNPSTSISYSLRERSVVTIEIFDLLGRKIKTILNSESQSSGNHIVYWNGLNESGENVSSGVYLYRLKANEFINTKKMMLIK
ncbi:MAG: choice-of-anchor D domain-containing protein [Ignavibacteriales bacterium]|nr:MAG: choice-of-anchor D domain-containing protein [Ignavibacteriales bacterium]